MGGGVIIRDGNGNVLISLSCNMGDVCQPLVAKLKALWRALKLCVQLNLHEVQLEGDALKVI